jgi:hypothetical protein
MELIYLEAFVLIVIIFFQFKYFFNTKLEIGRLKKLYPKIALNENNIVTVTYAENDVEQLSIPNHPSDEFQTTLNATNAYLRNNKGSADFNIIKSISERISESQENQIVASITTPLYLGLMGTFVGVILGLFKIIVVGGDKLLQGDALGLAINSLLLGVGIAMVASFFGLALTTYNNVVVLKSAIAIRNSNKNNYYNFLQTELLPNLDNNLYSALNLLKENIGDFNTRFTANLNLFDQNFGNNIVLLKSAVSEMSGQIIGINDNTKSQLEFLRELRKIDYNTLAKANIKMFDKMQDTAPILLEFIKEHRSLNENIHLSNGFVEKVGALMNRVSEFETNINGLGRDIQQSEMLGGEVIALIRKHLTSIDLKESLISEYASKSYSDVQRYLTDASERVDKLKRKIEIDFQNAFDFNAEGNLMQNLNYLKSINEGIGKLSLEIKSIKAKEVVERPIEVEEIKPAYTTPIIRQSPIAIPNSNTQNETLPDTTKRESLPPREWTDRSRRREDFTYNEKKKPTKETEKKSFWNKFFRSK